MVTLAATRLSGPVVRPTPFLFAIRAVQDPQVLLRIAGLYAQREIVPEQICCRKSGDFLLIDLEVVLDGDRTARILLEKIRSLVQVERASLVGEG